MSDKPAPKPGATARAAQTRAAPSPATIAKTIQRLQTTLSSELKSVYGATLRGIVPNLFATNGTTPLTANIRLILDDRGDAVGFAIGNEDVIDYRVPENALALWHASNSNLARTLRRPAIEERLARAITAIRLEDEMLVALAACGLATLTKSHIALAHKMAFGIVSECIANATRHHQQGSLNLLRAFLRHGMALLPEGGELHALMRHSSMTAEGRAYLLPSLSRIVMCRRLNMLPHDREHDDRGHETQSDFSWFTFTKGRTAGATAIMHAVERA